MTLSLRFLPRANLEPKNSQHPLKELSPSRSGASGTKSCRRLVGERWVICPNDERFCGWPDKKTGVFISQSILLGDCEQRIRDHTHHFAVVRFQTNLARSDRRDRKSTHLNSSHQIISY